MPPTDEDNDQEYWAAELAGSPVQATALARERITQMLVNSGEDPPLGYFPPQTNVASTRVKAFRYVPDDPSSPTTGSGTLFVEFFKRGDRYAYANVPFGTYANFQKEGVSKGRFINAELDNYPYRRAVGADHEFFNW